MFHSAKSKSVPRCVHVIIRVAISARQKHFAILSKPRIISSDYLHRHYLLIVLPSSSFLRFVSKVRNKIKNKNGKSEREINSDLMDSLLRFCSIISRYIFSWPSSNVFHTLRLTFLLLYVWFSSIFPRDSPAFRLCAQRKKLSRSPAAIRLLIAGTSCKPRKLPGVRYFCGNENPRSVGLASLDRPQAFSYAIACHVYLRPHAHDFTR